MSHTLMRGSDGSRGVPGSRAGYSAARLQLMRPIVRVQESVDPLRDRARRDPRTTVITGKLVFNATYGTKVVYRKTTFG